MASARKGKLYIVAGDDQTKDQSYFLWKLPQEILQRFLFPLGTYTKQEVREYLRQKGFEAKARGGESMEICFIAVSYTHLDVYKRQMQDLSKLDSDKVRSLWF